MNAGRARLRPGLDWDEDDGTPNHTRLRLLLAAALGVLALLAAGAGTAAAAPSAAAQPDLPAATSP